MVALCTDRYELTMLTSWIASDRADDRAAFGVFTRQLPAGRRYGVFAGLGRLLPMIEQYAFDSDEIDWLLAESVIDQATAEYLRGFRFKGRITAYPEGSVYFADSPVLTMHGSLAECALLETLILSVLNHDSAVAAAASRMVEAAGGRPLLEMGGRRVHEHAATAAARAAYLAGFTGTSNLAAGKQYGVPTVGTAAHSFVLAYPDEAEAFAAQVATQGAGTTMLVDTYDTTEGVRVAAQTVGPGLGAVRLDSGDLAGLAHEARRILDEHGCTDTKIVATSELDEYRLAELSSAPIDSYGVGTSVVTGSGFPTAGLVYKLVAVADGSHGDLRPVAKTSMGKESPGGVRTATRQYDQGILVDETYADADEQGDGHGVAIEVMREGRATYTPTLDEIREHARRERESLPRTARSIEPGEVS